MVGVVFCSAVCMSAGESQERDAQHQDCYARAHSSGAAAAANAPNHRPRATDVLLEPSQLAEVDAFGS